MEYLNFMFSGFWHFVGCFFIIAMILNFIFRLYNRFWRHWNIRKYGYPPVHCDADGDFKETEKD